MQRFVKYVPRHDLTRPGRFIPWGNQTIQFSRTEFPFRQQVTQKLIEQRVLKDLTPLESLHEWVPSNDQQLDKTTLQNAIAIRFYRDVSPTLMGTYRRFIKFIAQVLGTDLIYQAQPTFRFYFPGHPGQKEALIHSDVMLGHPPHEINVWLPLTRCAGMNSLAFVNLVDSLQLLRKYNYDFTPFEQCAVTDQLDGKLRYFDGDFGDCLLFDSRSLHGTPLNNTTVTRVSMDFRVIPVADYAKIDYDYRGTGQKQARFIRGDYYASLALGGTK